MGFDAMAHDAAVPASPKDVSKKKRVNRSAKLKQCKLDARREQWLSQVKNKGGCKATGIAASPPPSHAPLPRPRPREERDGSGSALHDSDLESPASTASGNSSRKDCPGSIISSGSSTGSCSRSASDTEEDCGHGDDSGPLDDWEAVADALSATKDDDHDRRDSDPAIFSSVDPPSAAAPPKAFAEAAKPGGGEAVKLEPVRAAPRAWRPDDACRPQSLPNVSKHRSFPADVKLHRSAAWTDRGILSGPSSCPICYEDLDPTDSSFLPCSCGFHLCLFCHKRILEDDGRCPSCRKQYAPMETGDSGGALSISNRLSHSCSIKY